MEGFGKESMKLSQQEAWNGDEESWIWEITTRAEFAIDANGALDLQKTPYPLR